MRYFFQILAAGFLLCSFWVTAIAKEDPIDELRALLTPGNEWIYILKVENTKDAKLVQYEAWVCPNDINFGRISWTQPLEASIENASESDSVKAASKGTSQSSALQYPTDITFSVIGGKPVVAHGREEVLRPEVVRIPIRVKGISRLDHTNLGIYTNIDESSICWIPIETENGDCVLIEEATWYNSRPPSWAKVPESFSQEIPLAVYRTLGWLTKRLPKERTLLGGRVIKINSTPVRWYKEYIEPYTQKVVVAAGEFDQCFITTIECKSTNPSDSSLPAWTWRERSWFKPGVGIVKWIQETEDGVLLVSLTLKKYQLSGSTPKP